MKWEDWLQSQITEDLEHALVALQPPEIVTPTERESPCEISLESACRTIGPNHNLNSHLMKRDQIYDGPSCGIETDSLSLRAVSRYQHPNGVSWMCPITWLRMLLYSIWLFPISPCGAWHVNL
jgi:hypothetical protein